MISKEARKRTHEQCELIIKQIAKELELKEVEVRETLNYTYSFILQKIREGKLEGINIIHLGTFGVKPWKRKKYLEYKERLLKDGSNSTN